MKNMKKVAGILAGIAAIGGAAFAAFKFFNKDQYDFDFEDFDCDCECDCDCDCGEECNCDDNCDCGCDCGETTIDEIESNDEA